MTSLSPNVALFLGHETSIESRLAYAHLRQSAGPQFSTRWLLDTACAPAIPETYVSDIVPYDSREFSRWGFATMGSSLLPGHCHLPVLRFFLGHPDIQWLWTVEYDVRFTGEWRVLFDTLSDDPADLLTCHVRRESEEPRWRWWNTLRGPESVAPGSRLRAYCVIARYSARALRHMVAQQSAGWRGHQEVIVPTLLARAGFVVRDINEAAAKAGAGRFYTSISRPKGSLRMFGTIRHRPSRPRAGLRENMLYHPVKPAQHTYSRLAAPKLLPTT